MKKTAVITSLVICLFIGMFMSSCDSCNGGGNKKLMKQITADKFEPGLKAYAEDFCTNKWGRGGNRLTGWKVTSSEKLGNIELTVNDDKMGKTAGCWYLVKMEGGGGTKMRTGSAEVYVTGIISISDGTLTPFVKGPDTDYRNVVHLDRLD